jgi:hypothetical protein
VTDTAPVFPPGRYGRRRAPGRTRRSAPAVLAVLLALGAMATGWRLYTRFGDPPYRAEVTSTEQVTDSSVTVTVTVHERHPGPATCQVQAKDRSGTEVGYAEVPVDAGSTVTVRYQLATTARPFAIAVLGCRIR